MIRVRNLADVRLILFDLDGVLLDSRHNMAAAWAEVQREVGISVPFERYFENIGLPFRDIMERIGLAQHAAKAGHVYRLAAQKNHDLLGWYPGASEILSAIESNGIKCGIVTSKEAERTNDILAGLPVIFDTVQTPTDSLRGKPAPDHLLMACARTNVDPAQTLFVGDMAVDCEAARRAGVPFAHAAWGYGTVAPDHGLVLRSLSHLQACFANNLAA